MHCEGLALAVRAVPEIIPGEGPLAVTTLHWEKKYVHDCVGILPPEHILFNGANNKEPFIIIYLLFAMAVNKQGDSIGPTANNEDSL